jgi:hypothetical protein
VATLQTNLPVDYIGMPGPRSRQTLAPHPYSDPEYKSTSANNAVFSFLFRHFFAPPNLILQAYPFDCGDELAKGHKLPYLEYHGLGRPPDDVGLPGDIWVDRTPEVCQLFLHGRAGWTPWLARHLVNCTLIPHPYVPTRVLWVTSEAIMWCDRGTARKQWVSLGEATGGVTTKTLGEVLSVILSRVEEAPAVSTASALSVTTAMVEDRDTQRSANVVTDLTAGRSSSCAHELSTDRADEHQSSTSAHAAERNSPQQTSPGVCGDDKHAILEETQLIAATRLNPGVFEHIQAEASTVDTQLALVGMQTSSDDEAASASVQIVHVAPVHDKVAEAPREREIVVLHDASMSNPPEIVDLPQMMEPIKPQPSPADHHIVSDPLLSTPSHVDGIINENLLPRSANQRPKNLRCRSLPPPFRSIPLHVDSQPLSSASSSKTTHQLISVGVSTDILTRDHSTAYTQTDAVDSTATEEQIRRLLEENQYLKTEIVLLKSENERLREDNPTLSKVSRPMTTRHSARSLILAWV